ncbi:MAG: hypothetical protein A3C43_06235 [Candidatus Schekmanbacteria bacterium RIFCSPHIGHO2_02_FULL_38_11]|uniref:Alginate export domain-containing protein n=1 Tax=Candidatus Schekmanbacteria bacterium RIFCSPLOWO2_12_FULL_38_15 TaxID=1817883 RepID=A0A1F7SF82_9BACT|nr:MAG: hypothetical protein A2043_02510 [Candidatus Schekmanbacteria bacterium GWA2_38_9]OGL50602.1 MAG: hypothetical protein A3H37_02010 [Candidatus Schekmanbacteria bacterium RIFCSPLOWO2_02_FULL_38_14]OGL52466.1 MAG: hypothetical protein A3G31_10770 [Candidatus Schekmanbacteria bacterium RIFCSPLOWO2_12_FULL_38_15]OGL55648.1 MAG: hypothetical protein A3C43_06235 [Candidatus Schekmanbacteria bacterium RIFCSPHIGHO2_02_FULL_38_11]
MFKKFFLISTCLFFSVLAGLASADIDIYKLPNDAGKLSINGEVRFRYEYNDWFATQASSANNDYWFMFNRTRLGLKFDSKYISAYVQGQYVHLIHLPDDGIAPAPAGALGVGPTYYASNTSQGKSPHGLVLRSAYIDLKNVFDSGVSTRLGRFDYSDGLEVITDDPKIMWVKRNRVGERLIGAFGYSAVTRAFDGFQVGYDNSTMNLTVMGSHPTQGGFEINASKDMEDIKLLSTSLTVKKSALVPNGEERLFYIYYKDDRSKVPRVDNTGLVSDNADIEINTFGANFVGAYDFGPGQVDVMAWGAVQFGRWYQQDHKAFAATAEAGYQFTKVPWKPWLRVGYFVGSGDNDTNDGDHETFFQLLPTARSYARFPIFNMMNNEDTSGMLIIKPLDNLTVRSDFHLLRLKEKNDRWYSGAGATREGGMIFGYAGRPSNNKKDLGKLLDVQVDYDIFKFLTLTAYYAHFFGDRVVQKIFTEKNDADFMYFETVFKF